MQQWRSQRGTRNSLLWQTAIGSLLLLSGCDVVHDETLVGRYKLLAIDVDEDMSLCWSFDNGGCLGDGLPGPTVFAAGFNDKYVVAAVHPAGLGKTTTQFFYVIRDPKTEDSDLGLPYEGIKGPFNQLQYEAEKARLHLPDFSRTFDGLK